MDFEVPEKSLSKIRELRPSPEHGIRIGVHGGGCSGLSYSMVWAEAPEPNDVIITITDVLIFIDKKSSIFLNGSTLEYEDGLTSAGFKLVSAKMKGVCGCGSSFSV